MYYNKIINRSICIYWQQGVAVKKLEDLSTRLELWASAFAEGPTEARKIAKLIMNLISENEMIYLKGYGTEVNVLALLNINHEYSPKSIDEVYELVDKFSPNLKSLSVIFKTLGREEEIDLLNRSLDVIQEKKSIIYAAEAAEKEVLPATNDVVKQMHALS